MKTQKVVATSLVVAGVLALAGALPGSAQQPRPQPGTKWSEEQIKQAVAPVRAGRTLTPRRWPNGARVAVCLSFDVDTESWRLAAGETLPVPLSQGEYGALQGLPRVLDLLDRRV